MAIFHNESRPDEPRYGLTGDMKKTQFKLQLAGGAADIGTLKSLLTAIESGMETEVTVLDLQGGEHRTPEYLSISPFAKVPALKEANYIISGAPAIMAYIDARG